MADLIMLLPQLTETTSKEFFKSITKTKQYFQDTGLEEEHFEELNRLPAKMLSGLNFLIFVAIVVIMFTTFKGEKDTFLRILKVTASSFAVHFLVTLFLAFYSALVLVSLISQKQDHVE
jgi:hypothetical protein